MTDRRGCGCSGCLVVLAGVVGVYAIITGKPWMTWPFIAMTIIPVIAYLHRRMKTLLLRRKAGELFDQSELGPLPPALREPPPRRGPFRGGYLEQSQYRMTALPLLIHGVATRGLVVEYDRTSDGEGPDIDFAYAWRDESGRIYLQEGHESYDAMHAALSQGEGQMLLTLDGGFEMGAAITIVYDPHDPSRHVVYDALLVAE